VFTQKWRNKQASRARLGGAPVAPILSDLDASSPPPRSHPKLAKIDRLIRPGRRPAGQTDRLLPGGTFDFAPAAAIDLGALLRAVESQSGQRARRRPSGRPGAR
jgi:hypothetical protein